MGAGKGSLSRMKDGALGFRVPSTAGRRWNLSGNSGGPAQKVPALIRYSMLPERLFMAVGGDLVQRCLAETGQTTGVLARSTLPLLLPIGSNAAFCISTIVCVCVLGDFMFGSFFF